MYRCHSSLIWVRSLLVRSEKMLVIEHGATVKSVLVGNLHFLCELHTTKTLSANV